MSAPPKSAMRTGPKGAKPRIHWNSEVHGRIFSPHPNSKEPLPRVIPTERYTVNSEFVPTAAAAMPQNPNSKDFTLPTGYTRRVFGNSTVSRMLSPEGISSKLSTSNIKGREAIEKASNAEAVAAAEQEAWAIAAAHSDNYHGRNRHEINSENFNSVNANLLANITVAPHVPDNQEATHLSDRKYLPLTSVGGSRTRRRKQRRQRAATRSKRRQHFKIR